MTLKTEVKREVETMRNQLAQMRGEIRLKLHLASMELKDELERLDPQLTAFEHRAAATREDVSDELREAFKHLKNALERVRDGIRAQPHPGP
jgi:hypothetical protein